MSIPSYLDSQTDFSAGELIADAQRDGSNLVKAGAKRMSDWFWKTRGIRRRPGFRSYAEYAGRVERFSPAAEVEFDISFEAGLAIIIDTVTGEAVQILTGCPWHNAHIQPMSITSWDNHVGIASAAFRPQVLTYTLATGRWSRQIFDFITDSTGKRRELFYRFAPRDITMLPSATTVGAITVTLSAAYFIQAHVGMMFRYVGRQIRIDEVLSPTLANATVIEELPNGQHVHGQEMEGFVPGQVVLGDMSDAKAEVIEVLDNNNMIVQKMKFSRFEDNENVVGPDTKSKVGHGHHELFDLPAQATKQWDESFMNAYRGWPASISHDRRRLEFCDFPQKPSAIVWSSVDVEADFNVTGDADGAIFEFVPDGSAVRYLVGGPDQFVFTDRKVFFIPISAQQPLKPGSVEFREIGTSGAYAARPARTDKGVVYIGVDQARIMAVVPTGQASQFYKLEHISRFHSHLIRNARAVVAAAGDENAPGQYIYVVNDDDTLTVGRFDPEGQWVGFMPWNIGGGSAWAVKSISAFGTGVVLAAENDFGGGPVKVLAVLDQNALYDFQRDITFAGLSEAIVDDTADPFVDDTGDPFVIEAEFPYPGETLAFNVNGFFRGVFTVGADTSDPFVDVTGDDFIDDTGDVFVISLGRTSVPLVIGEGDTMTVGWNFTPTLTPFVPNYAGGQSFSQRMRRRRIAGLAATVRGSQGYKVVNGNNERRIAAWRSGEAQTGDRPKRDETNKFRFAGRSHDPEISIVQDIPGTIEIIEIAMEVTS